MPFTIVDGSSGEVSTTLKDIPHEHYMLAAAARKMGTTEKAFEFFVLNGTLDARHNLTKQSVGSNFDTSINHIPVW